jgi:hypothetical protein
MPKKGTYNMLVNLSKKLDNFLLKRHYGTWPPEWVSIFFTRCKKHHWVLTLSHLSSHIIILHMDGAGDIESKTKIGHVPSETRIHSVLTEVSSFKPYLSILECKVGRESPNN